MKPIDMDSSHTVFLAGGAGHTGSRLARRLLADGWRVRCLARSDSWRRFLPEHENLEIVPGEVERGGRPGAWAERMAGAAACLNLAHISLSETMIAACERSGVDRIIALSSTRRFTRWPEATARQVIVGEAALEASGLNFTILRPTMIYGASRDNNLERIAGWLRRRRVMPLVRGGRNLVQPIFVDDLVEAILRALARPAETSRRALTVAGPEAVTWRAMIEALGRAIGRPPLWIPVPYGAAWLAAALAELKPGRPLATRDQIRRLLEDKAFDIAEASEALGGWRPRPLEEGLALKAAGMD